MSETTIDRWITELRRELELTGVDIDVPAVLDLAREVAHGVARPAAPVTTFVAGLAAGLQGGSPEACARALDVATSLAAARADQPGQGPDAQG